MVDLNLSLNVNIQNRTPRNDVCEGDVVVLRGVETFDFLGTNHLYEWTLPDGTTFTGRDLSATRPGTYTLDVLQNAKFTTDFQNFFNPVGIQPTCMNSTKV